MGSALISTRSRPSFAGSPGEQVGEIAQVGKAGQRPFGGLRLLRCLERAVDGGEHQILQHGDVARVDGLLVDLDLLHLALAVGGDHHHPAARRSGDGLLRQLLLRLLHLLLQRLRLLHERVQVEWHGHSSPRSRTSSISPPSTSTAARTAGCSRASATRLEEAAARCFCFCSATEASAGASCSTSWSGARKPSAFSKAASMAARDSWTMEAWAEPLRKASWMEVRSSLRGTACSRAAAAPALRAARTESRRRCQSSARSESGAGAGLGLRSGAGAGAGLGFALCAWAGAKA